MKLVIQIPCLNERDSLARTVADLPREIKGISEIEVLIIDDGSTDGTSELARSLGVHHIVRFAVNKGLAAAFTAGIDTAMRVGADIVVNTDADNQYRGEDIARLVEPILAGRADIVIGDRQTDKVAEFSPLKRLLQRWGSGAVRTASGTDVSDAPSGFRALSRRAATGLFVHNQFTYTLETLIQAGRQNLVLEDVRIVTNPKARESRLFKSLPDYLRRGAPVIVRAYMMYRPVQTFLSIAAILFTISVVAIGRFTYFYVQDPEYSGHIQSLTLGTGCFVLAFVVALFALTGELIATNRRLLEDILRRTRVMEWQQSRETTMAGQLSSTGNPPWRPGVAP
jgi:glycosyltransferase involved in cell wall biosynthesis